MEAMEGMEGAAMAGEAAMGGADMAMMGQYGMLALSDQ